MPERRARYAAVHWIRFPYVMTAERLPPGDPGAGCISWKIGWDGPVGPEGMRLPGEIVCGVALYADAASARAAFEAPGGFLPSLSEAVESWHALLLPVTHRGECNHLDPDRPGLMFEPAERDPGGALFVMTTAGFDLGPAFDAARAIDFRKNVDHVRDWMRSAAGCVAAQVMTPRTRGDDGVTMSVWRDDSTMASVMYGPGAHRTQLDRYRREKTADRTSFTRLRALATSGTWRGVDPFEAARQPRGAA